MADICSSRSQCRPSLCLL